MRLRSGNSSIKRKCDLSKYQLKTESHTIKNREENVLTCVPLVYYRIVDYLTILDLYRIKTVCKAWKECAENRIAIRESCYKAQILTVDIAPEDQCMSNNHRTGITSLKKNSDTYRTMRDWRKSWTSIPRAGICVCSTLHEWIYLCSDADNVFRYWLPDSSKLLIIPSQAPPPNIDPDVLYCDVSRPENFGHTLFNFLSLPQNSEHFCVEFLHLPKRNRAEKLDRFIENVKLEVEDPSTKLILVSSAGYSTVRERCLTEKVFPLAIRNGVVVTGSIFAMPFLHNSTHTYALRTKYDDCPECVILSFKGDDLLASSLLIDETIKDISSFKLELSKLTETVNRYCEDCANKCAGRNESGYCHVCSSQMIAIMTACCFRADASSWYQDDDVECDFESETFRQLIPNIPLLWVSGIRGIGLSMNLIGGNVAVSTTQNLTRGKCTIFSILRFQ